MSDVIFEGQVALVTGASRGIGAAIALELAKRGLKVIGTATTAEGAAKISQALSAYTDCSGETLDVNDAAGVDALVANIVKTRGGLHVLVNNAGITRDNLAMRMKDDEWDAVLDTNLKAVFRMSRAVMRTMMKQRYGRIISITSVVGASGNPGQANYAAAKAGVAGMTRALARELGSRHITVNCIAPGFIETDMTAQLADEQQKALLIQIPLGHLGKPSDIAHAVAYLASPQASYVTGQELHVNGGMYMEALSLINRHIFAVACRSEKQFSSPAKISFFLQPSEGIHERYRSTR
jgi:3-oxoacyl-[acyl-carrier protein] reductase